MRTKSYRSTGLGSGANGSWLSSGSCSITTAEKTRRVVTIYYLSE